VRHLQKALGLCLGLFRLCAHLTCYIFEGGAGGKNLAKLALATYSLAQHTRHAYGCFGSYAQIERVFFARTGRA